MIRKTFNNTFVSICRPEDGGVIWTSTEKRFGRIPNTNYAVEAAIYTAQKMGYGSVIVKLKGTNVAGMSGAINAIRQTGMTVDSCFIQNNVPYGGCRPRTIRR